MSFKDHFSRLAAAYARFRPRYPAALFDYLAQTCSRRERAWDCACGSGQASVDLAARFAAVVATDASVAQIAAAPAHHNILYRVAPAAASGLAAAAVDLVTVAQALHWFELAPFYAEVERVLRPGGVLAVWTYGVLQLADERLDRQLQEFYWQTLRSYWPAERALVESGYRSLPFPYAPLAAPPFQMHEQWSLRQLVGFIHSWTASARYVEQNGVDPAAKLEKSLRADWGDADSLQRIAWPLSVRLGIKP